MKFKIFTLAALFSFTASAQKLVSVTYLSTSQSFNYQLFTSAAQYNVDFYKITYNTTDVDGTTTIASGAMAIPKTSSCNNFSIGAYAHGTVSEKDAVPSRDNFEAITIKAVASTGVIGVAPDYLGLGDNPGLHPYLHAKSEATATLDLIRAVREYLADSTNITLNGEVFITGYSQGGHAAMAAVKYVQDSNLLSEFNIVAAGPASGPYNLSGSQTNVLLSNQPYSNPGYVCYLLFAMNRVYGDIFQNYDELLKAPYDSTIPPLFDGTNDMTFINNQLPNTLSGFIQDSVLANLRADSSQTKHSIWRALKKQDNFDWTPSFPVEMYYCTQDEQVSFQNALDADSAMNANGASSVAAINRGSLTHGGCFLPALQEALKFQRTSSMACLNVSLAETKILKKTKVFPNPGHSELRFDGLKKPVLLKISDASGKEMFQGQVSSKTVLNTRTWPAGIYILRFENEAGISTQKWVKD